MSNEVLKFKVIDPPTLTYPQDITLEIQNYTKEEYVNIYLNGMFDDFCSVTLGYQQLYELGLLLVTLALNTKHPIDKKAADFVLGKYDMVVPNVIESNDTADVMGEI